MSYLIIYILQLVIVWETSCDLKGQVELDEFQNVFVFDENTVSKYDREGVSHFSYSNLRNGNISSLDVTNPLRIVLYYHENNEVVFLDNTLSEQSNGLNLNDLSFYDASLVSSSFQNHLWVYRSAEQKIIRLNRNGEIVNETSSLALWLDNDKEIFVHLKESGNFLYLVSSLGNVLVFDQYGAFRKKVKLSLGDSYHFSDSKILYLKKGKILVYDIFLQVEEALIDITNVQYSNEMIHFNLFHLGVLNEGKLSLSRITR